MAFAGKYKGTTFRSLLELTLFRHLEEQGLEMGTTILYETVRVPYGRFLQRNYVVDVALPDRRTLIEVKPAHRSMNKNNWAKRLAAEKWAAENGWTYVVVTENELLAVGELLTLEKAAEIPGVELGEKAQRALRRKMARKARKR